MATSMFKISSALFNSSKNYRCVVGLVNKGNFSTTNVTMVRCITDKFLILICYCCKK